jgi:hypothetical protein
LRDAVYPVGYIATVRNWNVTFESQIDLAAVDCRTEAASNPALVIDVFGEVAPNGKAIGLRIQRSERGPVDLCLRSEDVQYFISLILALSHEAKRLQPAPEFDVTPSAAIPLPITAINVGQTNDDQAFLMLDIGFVSLTFGLPSASLEEVGQTLLALSARTSSGPS